MHKKLVVNIISRILLIVCFILFIPLSISLYTNPQSQEFYAFAFTIFLGLIFSLAILRFFPVGKKDLARMAMTYGTVYVATIAMGANDGQTVKAITEAEAYEGTSLIIAYSHCIAHGINMTKAMDNQKAAVASGHWPLIRFNPELAAQGQNPLILDSAKPKISFEEYAYNENRFKMLVKSRPEDAKRLFELAQKDADTRWQFYAHLYSRKNGGNGDSRTPVVPPGKA